MAVLRAVAAAGDLSKGKALHARLITAAHFDVVLHNNLISFYVKCVRVGLARNVFDAMPLRNAMSGNLLMSGYASSGRHKDSLALLRVVDFGLNEHGAERCGSCQQRPQGESSSSRPDLGNRAVRKRGRNVTTACYVPSDVAPAECRRKRKKYLDQRKFASAGSVADLGTASGCGRFTQEYIDALKGTYSGRSYYGAPAYEIGHS